MVRGYCECSVLTCVDYIVGSPDFVIRSESDFYELITQNTKKAVKLIVFGLAENAIRQVEIVPDFEWGGEGCLGCDVGAGMLHWIPSDLENKPVEIKPTESAPSPIPAIPQQVPPTQIVQPSQPIQSTLAPPVQQAVQPTLQPIQAQFVQSMQPPQLQAHQPAMQPLMHPTVTQTMNYSQPMQMQPPVQSQPQMPAQQPFAPMQIQPAMPMASPVPQPAVVSTAEFVMDDIPKPNFTVTTDMFNDLQ